MKVLENNTNDLLQLLLVEYSKIDFNNHCNLTHALTDLAFIELEVEGAELFAMVLIKKSANYEGLRHGMDFEEQLSAKKYYRISKVEVLESRIIANNDVLDVSSFRLSAAHDEKLFENVK